MCDFNFIDFKKSSQPDITRHFLSRICTMSSLNGNLFKSRRNETLSLADLHYTLSRVNFGWGGNALKKSIHE